MAYRLYWSSLRLYPPAPPCHCPTSQPEEKTTYRMACAAGNAMHCAKNSVALLAWGDAAPVKFAEKTDVWDFEIVMKRNDDCDANGCVLASAFFPDSGRHQLTLYPKMFTQVRQEQVETLVHEIGHVFGLRHFFANVSESAWASQIFGTHKPFSIMNYGSQSRTDRRRQGRFETPVSARLVGRADANQRHADQAGEGIPLSELAERVGVDFAHLPLAQ